MKELSRYTIAGTVGLGIDLLMFTLLNLIITHHLARILSFLVAVCVTYKLNAKFTFKDRKGDFKNYLAGQISGIAINFIVYEIMIYIMSDSLKLEAFLIGSGVAFIYNFTVAARFSFNDK